MNILNQNILDIDVRLCLMDLNSTVCDFDIKYGSWNLVYRVQIVLQ